MGRHVSRSADRRQIGRSHTAATASIKARTPTTLREWSHSPPHGFPLNPPTPRASFPTLRPLPPREEIDPCDAIRRGQGGYDGHRRRRPVSPQQGGGYKGGDEDHAAEGMAPVRRSLLGDVPMWLERRDYGPPHPRLQEVYHVRGTRGHRLLLRRVADLAATMQVPYSILSIIFIAGCIVRFPSFPRPSCTPLITCTTIPGLHLRCLSLPLPDGQVRLWIGTALHPLHFPWSYLLTTSYHRCPGGLHWYDMSCTILLHSR